MEELTELSLTNKTEFQLAESLPTITKTELPVLLQNKILLTEGVWNGLYFSKESIKNGFEMTDWADKKNSELIKDHADKPLSVDAFVGYVKNMHLSKTGDIDSNGKLIPAGSLIGDLELWDSEMVIKLGMAKAKFGISAKVKGRELSDGSFLISSYGNFSVVDNPACKNAYVNLSEDEEKNKELGKEVDDKVSAIKDSLKKKHPKWSDKKIDSAAWAITKSQEKKMSDEDEISEDDFKEEIVEEEVGSEDLQSNLLKGGLKEEQKMESNLNEVKESEVEAPVEEAKAEEVVKTEEAVEESKVEVTEEPKVEETLSDKLLAQLSALSNDIKLLSDRIAKMENDGLKAKELSAKVEGTSFKISKPMTVHELSSIKGGRHTSGVLAMAQQVMSLQSQ